MRGPGHGAGDHDAAGRGALPIKDIEIAKSFGLHPVSLSRFKAQAREEGAAALMPKRLGPKGPSKLTAQLERQIRELSVQGLSCRTIAKRLSRGKRKISYVLGDGPILSFALASSVNMNGLDTDPLTEEF